MRLLTLVALLCFPLLSACQPRHGCTVSEADLATPLTSRVDTAGLHTVLIARSVNSERHEQLLQIAEAAYPPQADVLARGPVPGADTVERDLWWGSVFDGVRQPYAITASAVRYYASLVDAFRQGRSVDGVIQLSRSGVAYDAAIDSVAEIEVDGERYRHVFVARLTLRWSGYCGSLCGQEFHKERIVVLTPAGRVLTVSEDGPIVLIVSAAEGVGHAESGDATT